MPLPLRTLLICLVLAPAGAGCARWSSETALDKSLLRPATPSDASVTLEIFFARIPVGQEEINGSLWEQVDEQHLPSSLRTELANNGFRAGLVGGTVPSALAQLLTLTDTPPPQEEQNQPVDVESEPMVRRRLLQLRSGRRGEILASGVYDELPLLMRDEGQLQGRTYKGAQCLFAISASNNGERRVRLTLTPELHHGEPKQQWVGRDGIFRLQMARPKEIFDKLRMETLLAPGQMLVLSCRPDRPGSLAHHFFTDTASAGREQKVLVIRLIQMPDGDSLPTDPMLSAVEE